MITLLKSYVLCWSIALPGLLAIACRNEIPSPALPQNQLTKVLEMRYLPDQQYANKSSKPSILYQGALYYYAVSTERIYRYDSQGRLIFDQQSDADHPTDPYSTEYHSYTYVGNKVIKYFSNSGYKDTLTLNSFGYAIPSFYVRNQTIYEYDQQGYLLKRQTPYQTLWRVINKNNVEKQVLQDASGNSVTEFTYDLTQPALIDPQALFAESKGAINLVTQSTTQYTTYGFDPYTVSISYSYLFDEQRRVKQQSCFQTNTVKGYLPILTIKHVVYTD